jgi:hypothetical protein
MYAIQTSMLRAAPAKAVIADGTALSVIPAGRMLEAASYAEYCPVHGLFRNWGDAPAMGSVGATVM